MRRHLLLVLVLGLCVEAGAQGLEARAVTDTSDYRVGDWIPVRVELRHPAGTTFQMLVGDSLGPYLVLDRQAFESVDSTETRVALVVARYDSGTIALPPLEFLASVPGDTTVRRVSTAALPLTVHTLAVSPEDSLRALKEPLSIPYTLAEILIALGVLLALVAGAIVLYRWLKARRKTPLAPVVQGPTKPPHLVALEELGAVKARRLWQQGHAKQYHSEVTEVLRRYFEGRFGVNALEETTDEILAGLRSAGLGGSVLETIDSILRRADLVKFATYQPPPEEHEESMSASVSVVQNTRPAAASAPLRPVLQENPEHVGT